MPPHIASDGKLLTPLSLLVEKTFLRRYFLASPMGTFGKNLRRIRTERGLASKALAKQAGVTPSMVSRWERKGVVPGTPTIQRVAKALDVRVDELIPESSSDLPGHTGTGVPTVEAEPDDLVDVRRGYQPDSVPVITEGEATPNGLLWTTTVARHAVIEYIGRPYDVVDPDAYGVLVIGDSMQPTFRKGHRLVVSPNTPVEDGDEVYVQLVDGKRLIKIAFKTKAGWRLDSVNTKYKPLKVLAEHVLAIHPIVWAKRKLPGLRIIDEQTGRRR